MNEKQQPEQHNQDKLEWLEPTFEVLHDPEGAGSSLPESIGFGPS